MMSHTRSTPQFLFITRGIINKAFMGIIIHTFCFVVMFYKQFLWHYFRIGDLIILKNNRKANIKNIPGQKHIHVPKLRENIDTTASSDDEEGKGILDDSEDLEDDANVSDE